MYCSDSSSRPMLCTAVTVVRGLYITDICATHVPSTDQKSQDWSHGSTLNCITHFLKDAHKTYGCFGSVRALKPLGTSCW